MFKYVQYVQFLVTLKLPSFRRLKEPAPAAFRTALIEGFRKEVHSFNPEVHQGAVEPNFGGVAWKLEIPWLFLFLGRLAGKWSEFEYIS